MSQQVIDYLTEKHAELADQVGAHELELVSQSFARVTDTNLLNQQRTMLTNITSGNTADEKLKSELTSEEKQYYVLLGMILFAFIYVFYFFLKYILSSKLRAVDEVQVLYGTAQLGQIPRGAGKRKAFAVADDLIVKLRNRNKRVFSYEEAVGLAAVAVRMSAKKNGFR